MSYTTEEKQGRIGSMGLAVLVNGSIIIAVALSPIVAVRDEREPPITMFPVDADKPKPDTKEIVEPKPLDPVYAPTPPFPLPPRDNDIDTSDKVPPTQPPVGGTGRGTNPPADPPPVAKPLPTPPFVAATRDPQYAGNFQPPYPRILETRGVEGLVKLRVLIGKDGRVRQVQIISATDAKFGEATERQALRSWRFRPATRGGEPVEDWQVLSVRFTVKS